MSGSYDESHYPSRSTDETTDDEICYGAASENGGADFSPIRDLDNSVQGLANEGEQIANRRDLGLEPQLNPNPQAADYINNLDDNEENGFPIPINPYQSPQHSPESVVDSVSSNIVNIPLEINRASDLLMAVSVGADENKIKISELSTSAMDELLSKAFGEHPLWQRRNDNGIEMLNEAEYIRQFRAFDASLQEIMRMVEVADPQCFTTLDGKYDFNCPFQQKPSFPTRIEPNALRLEASREIGFMKMNATSIVEWLMDSNEWSLVFSKIVSRATVLGVLSTGMAGSYDQTLQVMRAEFHMPTPLVPIRECQFARYCKQIDPNTWAVVDVSLEDIFPYPVLKFKRRPSGCVIQEMPDGNSKVTWVEHVEVDNSQVHRIFQPFVLTGIAFSARRWFSSLVQHCEWLSTVSSPTPNVPLLHGGIRNQTGKESLLRLTERMLRSFCADISASTNNFWVSLPFNGAEDFRVMTKPITLSPSSPTTSIAFTTSLWLPASPTRVYNLLSNCDSRNKWDLLSRGLVIRELAHMIKGNNPESRISVLQANSAPNRVEILYLQQSYRDPIGFYIVYAPIGVNTLVTVVSGGNPDCVNILPSGFVIHPTNKQLMNGGQVEGSVLTIFFHILDGNSTEDSLYIPRDSHDAVHRILTETCVLIKHAVLTHHLP